MPRRSGFTIIEVMVALVVSGIVLVGARSILEAVADRAGSITRAASVADRDANGERMLRALVDRLEVGTGPGTEFGGDPTSTAFASWCEVAGGWQERCTVNIELVRDSSAVDLVLRTSLGDRIVLRHGLKNGAIRYLSTPDGGGTWIRVWGAGITAPVAIGVFLERDTLYLRVGERG